jgi:hypothetical protein
MILKLLLPILFPSWRFFSSIGPSPRIDVGFIPEENAEPLEWIALNQLPKKISFADTVTRLFYNPEWNAQLHLNTCAEHLIENHLEFYEQEINRQLLAAIAKHKITVPSNNTHIKFRIRTLEYEEQLQETIVFVSNPVLLTSQDVLQ